MRLLVFVLAAAAVAFGGGFAAFTAALPTEPPRRPPAADAIVVLTGGGDRIPAAMSLLDGGLGQRLLITGVHGGTTRADVKELIGAEDRLFDCCVDFGYAARDTVGNAAEAAGWVRARSYRTVIVVTANYHMPRTLLELSAVLPDVRLVPYAVIPDDADLRNRWSDPSLARLLVVEYVKYLWAAGRLALGPGEPAAEARGAQIAERA